MSKEHFANNYTLRERIDAMPEDSILFRPDYPECYTEFVGSILSGLTTDDILVKIAQGIYVMLYKSRRMVLSLVPYLMASCPRVCLPSTQSIIIS